MEASWGGLCAKVLKRPYTEARVKILQVVVIFTYKGLFPFHKSLTIARRSRDSPRSFVKPWKRFIFRPRYYKNRLWRQGYFAPTIAHWQIDESDSSKWSPLSSCIILVWAFEQTTNEFWLVKKMTRRNLNYWIRNLSILKTEVTAKLLFQ